MINQRLLERIRAREDLLVALVGEHVEGVQHLNARVFAIWQPQTPPHGLLSQDLTH